MKSRMSSLNPYAASYVPLSRRGTEEKINDSKTIPGNSRNSESHKDTKQNQLPVPGKASHNFSIHGTDELLNSGDWTQKGHLIPGMHYSQSQNRSNITEKQILDEEAEIDLAYLVAMFPGLSEQSLDDVYSANGGDLESSIEMLTQLEIHPADVSQNLPDTLDICDVAVFGSSAESPAVKLKKTSSGEASASSSGPLEYDA